MGKRYPDLVANGSLIFDKPIKAKDLGKLLKEKFPHLGVKTTTQSKPMTPWEYLKS